MRDVLTAMIKAHEIQGCIALENSFNRVGLDHVRAGQGRLHRGRRRSCSAAHARADHQRALARLGRRPEPAHLSPRAQHRLAQELGRGRRHQPRGAPGADGAHRRDGLPVGAHREDLGLLRRRCSRASASSSSGPTAATSWRTCCSRSSYPGRIPRPDRGRSRDDAAPAGRRHAPRRHRPHRDPTRRSRRAHHRQDRARWPIPPTATTASSTWSPCR